MQLDPLEDRLAPSATFDRGDSYWAGGQRVELTQTYDTFAVNLNSDTRVEDLLAKDGPFAGGAVENKINASTLVIRSGTYTRDLADGLNWVSPLYVNKQTQSWVIVTNEVIVALKPGETAADFFAGDQRFSSYRPLLGTPDQYYGTVANGGLTALQVASSLKDDPRLEWASPDFYQDWKPQFTPNDTFYPQQWHLNNTGQNSSTPDADVDAPEAWDITPGGSPNIIVAIIDTGVDVNHPDLAANIAVNTGEIPNNSIDDDGNGWIDDVQGWDFTSNDNNAAPSGVTSAHGTAAAGVTAARGNNGTGVAGIAYQSKILPVRIFGDDGNAVSDGGIASALYYAAGRTANGQGTWRGADILSNSWSGGGLSSTTESAISWATSNARGGKGAASFFATGNGGTGTVGNPAASSAIYPGVIAVGASTDLDTRASYSQYGTGLDFLAPSNGGHFGIVTTDISGSPGYSGGSYLTSAGTAFGGTSSATPLAAGIGALALAVNPNLTAAQIKQLMRATTDFIDPATANYSSFTQLSATHGYGRVNAFTALNGVGVAKVQVLNGLQNVADGALQNFSISPGQTQDLTLRVRNQGTQALSLSGLTVPAPFSILSGFSSTALTTGQTTTFTVRYAPTAAGTVDRALNFTTNDTGHPVFTLNLHGTAVAPTTVAGFQVNSGNPQRSRLISMTIDLAGSVNAGDIGPITLTRTIATVGGVVGTVVTTQATGANGRVLVSPASGTTNSLLLTFDNANGSPSSAGVQYGSLADGYWQLSIPYLDYTSPLNDPSLRRFFGDYNNDDLVEGGIDFPAFGADFNRAGFSPFDFNGDNVVDGVFDFPAFGARFNVFL